MTLDIVKFIPPQLRLEITQKIIEENGIRPLAREIGVSPKSVYKYKRGEAHPRDEVMARILAIAKRDAPHLLDEVFDKLRNRFSNALESPIDPEKVLATKPEEQTPSKPGPLPSPGKKGVDRKSTEEPSKRGVDQKSTEGISFERVFARIGVSEAFNQSKVGKILESLSEGKLNLSDLVEWTGLSTEAVEKYLEMLEAEEIVELTPSSNYKLSIKLEEE